MGYRSFLQVNITVKVLWDYSENAVKIHLWTAIISYLTIAKIKTDYNHIPLPRQQP